MKHDYQTPFDMSLLSDNIIMAFTDPIDCLEPNQPVPEDNYRYFTTNFTGKGIHTYYLFQTKEAFIQAWIELYNKSKGMWYWVLDHGTCICSGALDPDDISIFEDHWNTHFNFNETEIYEKSTDTSEKTKFINQILSKHPKANPQILRFIANFSHHVKYKHDDAVKILTDLFTEGYCYYFAIILQTAFPGGEILWAAPNDHMVYKYQGQYYDITGIYEDIAFSFIPVEKMGDCLLDFKHIPGNHYNASEQELAKIQWEWEERHNNERK